MGGGGTGAGGGETPGGVSVSSLGGGGIGSPSDTFFITLLLDAILNLIGVAAQKIFKINNEL